MSDAFTDGRSSYPGGKSGSGIYQRLINLIPPHDLLIVPFAGHCGIVRNLKPAEHTIVIDLNPDVCDWWHSWSRSKRGRDLEIHNCDGIEWLRFRTKATIWARDSKLCDTLGPHHQTHSTTAQAFIFADPPYVIRARATGRIYECELTDADHQRLVGTMTMIDASEYSIMLCGYRSPIYRPLFPWNSIDHRVPTRGGLQDECIWMNYHRPEQLHDYRHLGDCRRSRERIRRRQRNWLAQLNSMDPLERAAMLEALNRGTATNADDTGI